MGYGEFRVVGNMVQHGCERHTLWQIQEVRAMYQGGKGDTEEEFHRSQRPVLGMGTAGNASNNL